MSEPYERIRLLAAVLDADVSRLLTVLFVLMAFALGFAMHGCIAKPVPQTATPVEDPSKPRVLRVQLQILGSAVSGGPVEATAYETTDTAAAATETAKGDR